MKQTIRTRLYASQAGASLLVLKDEDSLGVRRTLRLRPEEWVACFNGDGVEYFYRIVESARREILLALEGSQMNPRDHLSQLTVWIASTKGNTKDRIVRDLPPLGVTRIIFYRSERTVSLPREDNQTRLGKIAAEACRQCGRSSVPPVQLADLSLSELCESGELDPVHTLLFWEKASSGTPASILDANQPLHLIFGPEGGFSEEEMRQIQTRNIFITSLGDRILRTELAVTAGVAIVQFQRGFLR